VRFHGRVAPMAVPVGIRPYADGDAPRKHARYRRGAVCPSATASRATRRVLPRRQVSKGSDSTKRISPRAWRGAVGSLAPYFRAGRRFPRSAATGLAFWLFSMSGARQNARENHGTGNNSLRP
jgi:hypothetical protein